MHDHIDLLGVGIDMWPLLPTGGDLDPGYDQVASAEVAGVHEDPGTQGASLLHRRVGEMTKVHGASRSECS
jgi:hypothetical protein